MLGGRGSWGELSEAYENRESKVWSSVIKSCGLLLLWVRLFALPAYGRCRAHGYPQLHSETESSLSYMRLSQETHVVIFSVFQSCVPGIQRCLIDPSSWKFPGPWESEAILLCVPVHMC